MQILKLILASSVFFVLSPVWAANAAPKPIQRSYTVISSYNYAKVIHKADNDVEKWLAKLNGYRSKSLNKRIILLAGLLNSKPYLWENAEGEGTFCPGAIKRDANCVHIQQGPVYRSDGFNCNTLISMVLALLNAHDLASFKRTILTVNYGAAGLPANAVRFCNRNNFVSSAFNPINQLHGYMKDVTDRLGIVKNVPHMQTTITPRKWFANKFVNPASLQTNVRVLKDQDGEDMVKRLTSNYVATFCPKLEAESVKIAYVPKQSLVYTNVLPNGEHRYIANQIALNKIPTPAILEIVRDDNKWIVGDKSVKDILGSGIAVSHLGIVYRQQFRYGDTIYQRITCHKKHGKKSCRVFPVNCTKQTCNKLMFLAATNSYPDGYYYYKQDGAYKCVAQKPAKNIHYTSCNRVVAMPLAAYLTQRQYGKYPFMNNPSVVGFNVELILPATHLAM